ncbi:MAG: alpha-mannosidase [Mycobacterium leprae]
MDKRSKEITFTMIGHAHIDPVWLWDWREGYETVKGTFRSAVDRLKENPEMVFVHSSASHYEWMENHPQLFGEIKEAVARGQWEPVGGWWVEPDVNVPSGEALARQGLYGQRYFQQKLGRRANVAFLPDSFGHPATLPMLFKQAGMDYFVFMRPGKNEIDLPSNMFWWEAPDGSRVLTARVETYNTNPVYVNPSLERNIDWRPPELKEWIHIYGVGNHGGGPTKKAIASIKELQKDPNWPTLQFDTLQHFFERATKDEHPVVAHELQHHARGCYAAYSPIKRLNRRAENALLSAEKLSTFATFFGLKYPTERFTQAWHRTLFNQFHDILAGSSIASAYEDAHHEMGEALSIAAHTMNNAFQTIAQQIDTRRDDREIEEPIRRVRWTMENWTADLGDGVPIVVFNPNSWPRTEVVEVETNDWGAEDLRIMDHANEGVVHQLIPSTSIAGARPHVVFMAEVPPMGYRVYRIVDEPGAELPADAPMLEATESKLENTWWKLTFDPATGALFSLYDKVNKLELLAGAGAQPLVIDDPTDTWGHGIVSMRHLEGAFESTKIELLEKGPVRATMRISYIYGERTAAQQLISIYREIPNIDGKFTVDWHEQQKALKLAFPMAVGQAEATFDNPYGHVTRMPVGEEEPLQMWMDVTGQVRDAAAVAHPYGVALLNDSKYSGDIMGGEMRLTVLRSPVYAHHDPNKLNPNIQYEYQDQGEQTFRWSLLPHAGSWQDAGVVQAAVDVNTPLPFVREYAHPGELDNIGSFLTVDGQAIVSAVKQAEEGDDLVIRLWEPNGRSVNATVNLPLANANFTANLKANQVTTYRISRTTGAVKEVNFLEE